MRWTYSLGTLFGVPIQVHVTLLVLLAALGLFAATGGGGLAGLVAGIVVMAMVFGSVLLHEVGHALTARRFGVATREIVLHPIGGTAVLDAELERPLHEAVVALAGPAVNLALAGGAWLLSTVTEGELFVRIAGFNLILGGFNLLPALPLDGGRALRAGLTAWMGRSRATRVAARLGRLTALALLAVAILYAEPILGVVAIFVFVAASSEERSVMVRDFIGDKTARDVALAVPHILGAAATPLEAMEVFVAHPWLPALPVAFGDRVVGVVHREALVEALQTPSADGRLTSHLDRRFIRARDDMPLRDLLAAMGESRSRAVVLFEDDERQPEVSGMVLLDDVIERVNAGRHRDF